MDDKVLARLPSQTSGVKYELREGADGVPYCTCPAWRFSRSRPRDCKHLRTFVRENLALLELLAPEE